MVVAIIRPIIVAGQILWKYRTQIYKIVVAQDKTISKAWQGYGKATNWGVRTGAGAGSLIGSLITNTAEDTPGNGIPKTTQKLPPTSKPYKTRGGYSRSNYLRSKRNRKYCYRPR